LGLGVGVTAGRVRANAPRVEPLEHRNLARVRAKVKGQGWSQGRCRG